MYITEPTTMATDYMLGILCLMWGWKTRRLTSQRCAAQSLWTRAFFATGVAALLGGTVHGFTLILQEPWITGLWNGALYLTGFASFFMLASVVLLYLPRTIGRLSLVLCVLKLGTYLVWVFNDQDFRFVVYDYGSSLLIILGFQLFSLYKRQSILAGWIASGVLLSFIGAAIQQSGFSLHTHFNHNDFFHVIQACAFYFFYRGGLLFTRILNTNSIPTSE
ncbi:MAG: hypothetical protein VYA53_06105 [Acidobacteriota bacterium]|nr:hypothetical protein [Acidobacteriota bacterium]